VNDSLQALETPTRREPGDRGIRLIPDRLANAAGITCSFLEPQNSEPDVLQKVNSRVTTAFGDVHGGAEREEVSLRVPAHLIAVERVAHACRQRGWV
jgi:glutamate dehydrogenase (NAD(P)+)